MKTLVQFIIIIAYLGGFVATANVIRDHGKHPSWGVGIIACAIWPGVIVYDYVRTELENNYHD